MKHIGDYWQDENGNKWSFKNNTKNEAIAKSIGLVGCQEFEARVEKIHAGTHHAIAYRKYIAIVRSIIEQEKE